MKSAYFILLSIKTNHNKPRVQTRAILQLNVINIKITTIHSRHDWLQIRLGKITFKLCKTGTPLDFSINFFSNLCTNVFCCNGPLTLDSELIHIPFLKIR